jgi:hypothetical protein
VAIQVVNPNNANDKAKVNQFTLNVRPFALNDMIGNSLEPVNERISDRVTFDELKSVDTSADQGSTSAPDSNQCTATDKTSCLDIAETLNFQSSGGSGVWSNGVCVSGNCQNANDFEYYWVNPGYFQSLTYDTTAGVFSYTQDVTNVPDWKKYSGLDTTAVENPRFVPNARQQGIIGKGNEVHGNVNDVPGLPVATTAEEWIFINNSDIGHPFHIHINPFFVMEVGQLSYEQFADKQEWVMRAVSWDDSLPTITSSDNAPTTPKVYETTNSVPDFVGNWWDTVIVPPHGYVRMRYWMNVPNQTGAGTNAVVEDDYNKIGVWVYHCHILRHEDRGMMMPVITQQLTGEAPGPVQCPAGMTLKKTKVHHH